MLCIIYNTYNTLQMYYYIQVSFIILLPFFFQFGAKGYVIVTPHSCFWNSASPSILKRESVSSFITSIITVLK